MEHARFLVSGSFTLSSRPLLFVTGDVVRGVVRAGMVVDDGAGFREPIHAVERVRTARGEAVALGFHSRGGDRLAAWQDLPWAGRTLAVAAPDAGDAPAGSSAS